MAIAYEVICYDIRSLFDRNPHLAKCPRCSNLLEKQEIQHSIVGIEFSKHSFASIPGVDTWLFRCQQCGWWAVREHHTDYETVHCDEDYLITTPLQNCDEDYLITTPLQNGEDESAMTVKIPCNDPMPWQHVLNTKAYWEHPCKLSLDVALLLFGAQEVQQKGRKEQTDTITT